MRTRVVFHFKCKSDPIGKWVEFTFSKRDLAM
jgi:hypothetical protein